MSTGYQKRSALEHIPQWNRSNWWDIDEAYGRPSWAKKDAWWRCKRICAAMNGRKLRVITKSHFIFTAGFEYTSDDGIRKFMYITPSYDVIVDMP